jgi:hypothetical protein
MLKKRMLSNDRFDIESELADELSNEIAKNIDFEFLTDILIACGWTCVKLDRFRSREHSVDVVTWCHDKTNGKWKHNGRTFIFEQQKDATWFALNWL